MVQAAGKQRPWPCEAAPAAMDTYMMHQQDGGRHNASIRVPGTAAAAESVAGERLTKLFMVVSGAGVR